MGGKKGEAVQASRQTTKWAQLSAFHPCRQPLQHALPLSTCTAFSPSKNSKCFEIQLKWLHTNNHQRVCLKQMSFKQQNFLQQILLQSQTAIGINLQHCISVRYQISVDVHFLSTTQSILKEIYIRKQVFSLQIGCIAASLSDIGDICNTW